MPHHSLLPAVPDLIAFEAAARHGSISRAAEELSLTQGAVSRRIQQLEEFVGVALFNRVRQRIVLTDGGRVYAAEARKALDHLAQATQRAMSFAGRQTLSLAVLPTFGARWLIPRMPLFQALHPQVTVHFSARLRPFDFQEEPFDAAIHYGAPHWPGAVCEHLMQEDIVAVASPAFRRRHRISKPADLGKNVVLLQQSTRPSLWADWFRASGLDTAYAHRGPMFEQFNMVAQAAASGLGAALVPRILVEEELAAGKLSVVRSPSLVAAGAYYLAYPESRARTPLVGQFRDWLMAAARASQATHAG